MKKRHAATTYSCLCSENVELRLWLSQKFRGQRMFGCIDVPEVGAGDPPAFAVPEEFDAIDAAAFDFAIWRRTAFGSAEHMGDVSCTLGDAMDFVFVESFAANRSLTRIHKFLVGHGFGVGFSCGVFADGN